MALIPHPQLLVPWGMWPGSGDLALLFWKEGQWEETSRPSIPRLRNWGKGRRILPRVLKPHVGEGQSCVRKQADVGKASHSGKKLSFSVAAKDKGCVEMPRTSLG